ncbi:E3 ubiquitin-protein ligase Arkadia-like [Pieris napi]|uniref:E3 ubiquitin-protein ligase Arkadia-like n=1 Tax=Pieris napi TaxID=78633 RepID=UPI001FBA57A7|nr:E3 ubiquitin-protein ligase Arkadia-like [Pieris napi]
MKLFTTAVVLCIASSVVADVAHVKAAKAKLISHLAGNGKYHKRGILSHVPPFKLGHDIPLVTHSVVKPLVVNYPPTATIASVKVPLTNPQRYPVGVGHKVTGLPHPHYALRFPHTKYYVKPDHHFHHHHHHVEPKPVVPVVPAPVAPVGPIVHTAPVAHPLPAAVLPAPPAPIASPPLVFPQTLKPLLSAASIPLTPGVLPRQVFPLQQQYVIRPGAAVQSSYFATYPRYPLINSYQAPLFPVPAISAINDIPAIPTAPSVHQVIQSHNPHFHLVPQAYPQESPIEQHSPNVVYEQTPTLVYNSHDVPQPAVHVHPTQETFLHPTFNIQPTQSIPHSAVPLQPTQPSVPVEHDGWSPVPSNPETLHHDGVAQAHQFVQEQGTQVYEQHDFQHQIHQHIQQQIEQAQYEQSLHNQHHLQQEYGVPQVSHDYAQPNPNQGQDFLQQAHDFSHNSHDLNQQGHDLTQHGYDFSQQGYDFSQGHGFSQADFAQQGHDFEQGEDLGQHPRPEYGVPQSEGRSTDDDIQQFHNHIPLSLQPPIDRPLDHFQ